MIELGTSHNILAADTGIDGDWIYLLFVLGVSVLSWIGNIIKKRREGEEGDEITDVEPAEFLEDEEHKPLTPASPPAARPHQPPAPPRRQPAPAIPPPAQPIPRTATSSPQQSSTPSGPAVVLAHLKRQLEAKPAQPPQPVAQRPIPVASAVSQSPAPVGKTAVPRPKKADSQRNHGEPLRASAHLRDRQALRKAIVLAEILDRPVALRENPPGKWH